MSNTKLPALPEIKTSVGEYHVEDMREYARAAILADRERQVGDAVAWQSTMRDLLDHVERNTCMHEDTYRGGAIWEICRECGAKWADDEGGKPEFKVPAYVDRAHELLASLPAHQAVLSRGQVIDEISPLSNNSADHDIDFAYRILDRAAVLASKASIPEEATCERCGIEQSKHNDPMHWCDNQSFTFGPADRERQAGEAVADEKEVRLIAQNIRELAQELSLEFDTGDLERAADLLEGFASLPAPKAVQAESMRERLQKQCSAWGAYWRASDAHGVELTKPQAIELLQDALGVEVEIKDNGCQACDGTGMIGGPSYYSLDEGGMPCPACAAPSPDGKAEQAEAPSKLADYHREQYEHAHAGWEACKQECDRLRDELVGKAMTPDEKRDRFARDNWAALTGAKFPDDATQPTASNAGEGETLKTASHEIAHLSRWKPDGLMMVNDYQGAYVRRDHVLQLLVKARAALATQPTASNAGEREASASMNLGHICQQIEYARDHGWPPECKGNLEWMAAAVRARAALASKPPAGEQKPFAWATFDGEGSYDLRLFEDNEDYREQFIKRNGPQFTSWVLPLYLPSAQPEQVAQDSEETKDYRWLIRGKRGQLVWNHVLGVDEIDGHDSVKDAIRAARARGEGERP